MALTDKAIRAAKPAHKSVRLFDGGGLYLEVAPTGGKWWRLKYRFAGKEKRLSLGVYPAVPLAGRKDSDSGQWIKGARDRRDDAKQLLVNGIDPSEQRKARRAVVIERAANSFEAIAREWFANFSKKWVKSHSDKIIKRLEQNVFPNLGGRPIAEITSREMLGVLRKIEDRKAYETAHRTMQNCSQVFRYAVATGRAERDPTVELKGALTPSKERHHPSITDAKGIGALLRAIDGYDGSPVTKCALRLASLTFVRPGELRRAEWAELNLDKSEWRIPGARMKMREQHIVPLSKQAVAELRELQKLTGRNNYVFPGARTNGRPMSENTVNAALRRLGYSKDQMTGHGFRSMASTHLNEQGWNRDAIERQLAHAERDGVRAAYNFAEHLPERRKMMQAWADYLDGLRVSGSITSIRAQEKVAA
ncbi:MAG TPA: tyrosine-type recombinase/integrase [Burkholderiales bacterium]|nr:tyrosine-type recombinase/integrase [Burkholderiales bacterium]